jgi:predicted dehydrogenase
MRWGIVGAGLHAEQRIVPALAKTKAERLHGVAGSGEAAATAFSQRVGIPSRVVRRSSPIARSTPSHHHAKRPASPPTEICRGGASVWSRSRWR